MRPKKICTTEGCGGKHVAKGLCGSCYARFKRNGTVEPLVHQSKKGEALRFLENLKGSEACVLWPFGKGGNGYGVVKLNGRQTSASRASCTIHHGPPPDKSYEAAHSCGEGHRGCVNPLHLSWKTPKENAVDKVEHKTSPVGIPHPSAKLTEDDVRFIRRNYGEMGAARIAEKFSIKRTYAWEIARGKTWRHIT